MRNFLQKNWYLLLVLFLILVVLAAILPKALPYISSSIPLGYDPGLYRYFFLEYMQYLPNINYNQIAGWTQTAFEPFLWYLWIVLQSIGYGVDFLLTRWLVFFSIVTSIFIYFVLKPYGQKTARIGVILFLISIVQYQAFWWHYYKQVIGIIFMLGSLWLIHRKQYLLSIPLIIATLTIQRPAGLFLLLTIVAYSIGLYIQEKKLPRWLWYTTLAAGLAALICYLPLREYLIAPLIKPLLWSAFIEWQSGTFFSKDQFVFYALPYILLTAYGLYLKYRQKAFDIVVAGAIIGLIWIGGQLFFYNRMLIFMDIFLILMSAWTLGVILKNRYGWILVAVVLGYQSIHYGSYVANHQTALIPQEEFALIQKINTELPQDAIMMVSHKNYSPRIVWYTYRPTIAPWLLDRNPRNLDERKTRRTNDGATKCRMLQEIEDIENKKIYLRIGSRQPTEDLSAWNCFQLVYAEKDAAVFSIYFNTNDQ